jgi:hypothetical protein
MEKLKAARQAFDMIRSALDEKLIGLGYLIAQEKADDILFESSYAIWSNNRDMVRFTWDGLESVFLIDTSTDIPLTPLSRWLNISITTFNPAFENSEYIFEIAKTVIGSLD